MAGFGAVFFKALPAVQQLLLDQSAAFLPFLNVIELATGLVNPCVKKRDSSEFIDDSASVAVAHRHDAGHIPLHHHIAAFRVDAKSTQLGLELLQVAGNPIGAVAGAVRAPGHHPELSCDGPFVLLGADPWTVFRCFQAFFRGVGRPLAEVKAHADDGFGRFACLQYAAVDEVGQAIRSHAAAGRQSKAEQHTVENIALSGTIRPRHHGETLLKRDAHCPTEGLEVRQTNLIDVDHQDSGEADTPR